MNAPIVEIRHWIDDDGTRYAQYRVRGGSSLAWIPMGTFVAQKAIAARVFHGLPVEVVGDVRRTA